MTRREEIQQAILENGIDYCEEHPEMNLSLKDAFVMGAVWADKTMIERVEQWLIKNNRGHTIGSLHRFLKEE